MKYIFKNTSLDDSGNALHSLAKGDIIYVRNGVAKLIANNSVNLSTAKNKYGYRCDSNRVSIVFKIDSKTTLSILHNTNTAGERYMSLYSFISDKPISEVSSADWINRSFVPFTSYDSDVQFEGGNVSNVSVPSGHTSWTYINAGCLSVTWEDLPKGYYVLEGVGSESYIYCFDNDVADVPVTALTLTEIKKHLNIDREFTDDDDYLMSLCEVAEQIVSKHIDCKFSEILVDGKLPAPIRHACLLFIGNMYDNRESVSPNSMTEIPQSLTYILNMYRDYENANI